MNPAATEITASDDLFDLDLRITADALARPMTEPNIHAAATQYSSCHSTGQTGVPCHCF